MRWVELTSAANSDVFRRTALCLLLAQSGHLDTLNQCPLSGVKRTLLGHCGMSAFDPKRTSPACGGNATHTLLLRLTVSFPTYRFCARDSVTREGEQDWGR